MKLSRRHFRFSCYSALAWEGLSDKLTATQRRPFWKQLPARRWFASGLFEADLRNRELRKAGLKVKLQDQPFEVLKALLELPGDTVTREELRAKIWPADTFVDFDVGLNTAIKRLRDALGDTAENPRFVETIPRRGYRFLAPVELLDSSAVGVRSHATKNPWGVSASMVGLVVTVILTLAIALTAGGWRNLLPGSGSTGRVESLAVLPLENLSRDPEQEYFADGMTDQLITELSKIGALQVISRSSVMQYKRARKPLAEIGRELNVDAVVEGTILRAGSRVRITAQLIQANTESHLWANSYEGDLTDILTLQSGVAQAIAGAIRINLTAQDKARLANTRPVNPEAQEAYLRARHHHSKRTAEDSARAIDYFTRAVALDPSFALPYAWLADTYHFLGTETIVPPRQAYPQAKAAALKAVEIDPTLSTAYAALGVVASHYEWNWATAENNFERAIELDADDVRAHEAYGMYLNRMGRFDEGLRAIKRAQLLDPLSIGVKVNVGNILFTARRYDQAVEELRRAVEMGPNSPGPHFWLGRALMAKGLYEEALGEFRTATTLAGDPRGRGMSWLAYIYALSGQRSEATRILDELKALSSRTYVSAYGIARIYVALGDHEQAFKWLDRAYDERAHGLVTLKVSPLFDPLRSDPRFQDLLRRMRFPS